MFCSTLRKRPLWRTLGPVLASTSAWKLKESQLETHDLALPLPFKTPGPLSRILVLSRSNMMEAGLSDAKARIQQFATMTKGQARLITLILEDEEGGQTCISGLQAFMRLQMVLFESDTLCPAIPVPDVPSLLTVLKDFLNGLQPSPESLPAPPLLTDLIMQATASAPAKPLSQHDANVISDIFSSMQDFERATRTRQGQSKLCNFLDRTIAEDVVDFWADEWIV